MSRDIKLEDFSCLCALKKSFLAVFFPTWLRNSRSAVVALQSLVEEQRRHASALPVLTVSVRGGEGDESETFVIDNLYAQSLPFCVLVINGERIRSDELSRIAESAPFLAPQYSSELNTHSLSLSPPILFSALFSAGKRPIRLFISGDRSSVGKSSTCLALLAGLVAAGVPPSLLAYIKPTTQCEAEQPVARYCQRVGISCRSIGPVVFYQGFTRAYLAGETESATEMIHRIVKSVEEIERDKALVLIDGVGYPSVGSICNISNGHVAAALSAPVMLVGKSGVGDAVDSYNLNATFFESFGVTVLGGIFNKIDREGFYNLAACRDSVSSYFQQYKSHQMPYGFVPKMNAEDPNSVGNGDFPEWTSEFVSHIDLSRLVHDAYMSNIFPSRSSIETRTAYVLPQSSSSQKEEKENMPQSNFVARSSLLGVKRSREEVEADARRKGAVAGG